MNAPEDQNHALHDMLEAYLEGTISPREFARLEALIGSDPEVRRQYVEFMDLHASLDHQARESSESSSTDTTSPVAASPNILPRPPVLPTPAISENGFTALLGAGLVLMSLAIIVLFTRSFLLHSDSVHDTTVMPEYVATLVSAQDCRWKNNDVPQLPGAQLQAGQLHLVEGVVELVFLQGARVTLTGPVVFDLLSANRGALRSGRLTADVPDSARGFTVEAPGGEVIDYGTEFAIVVNDSGHSDVNVIKGEVEVVGNNPVSSQTLFSGDVLRFDIQGKSPLVNLAAEPGAKAFAADVIAGFPDSHQIEFVNDGQYGNSSSWIGGPQSRFIAIRLPALCSVEGVAFGRDNTGSFLDRCLGHYELQYTTVAAPSVETPDEQWTTIDTWDYDGNWPDRAPAVRHRYDFNTVQATAVRLMVPSTDLYVGTAIDELEVYGYQLDDTDG